MATYYVAKTGSNSNNGTSLATAWLTIQKAFTAVVAGDIVNVDDGTYTEANMNCSVNGTSANKITFQSINLYGAKLVGNNGTTGSAVILSGDYLIIKRFDVTGGNAVGIDAQGSFDEIRNNYVHDVPAINTGGFGGAMINFSNFPTKTNGIADSNLCLRIGDITTTPPSSSVQGLYAAIPNVTFSNNIVCGVEAYAINTGHYSINCIIVNNTLFGNGNPGLDSGGVVLTATDAAPTSNGHRIRNNIIYDNKGIGIHEEGTQGSDIIYSNNFVVGNNTNFGTMNGHSNTNNITSGIPGFINYLRDGSGNYQLLSTSQCKDAGTSTNGPAKDFIAVDRPVGAAYDIGCYEFNTAPPPAPPLTARLQFGQG